MDPTARQSIIDRVSQATNILVTVKNGPSVDQLAACIGLTLFLNHMEKHGTAVFSGEVPSTLEFLKPDETIEKTTDSLRDFIIALDKAKADKLRYKIENDVVKIFITPYRTSLTQKDFDFSQGDFNVDVVIALGIHAKEDLDQAIVQHGRILHDATVISLNNGPGGGVGTLHLEDAQASSLCEMVVGICEGLKPNSFDPQMATAFLTGIVAETERFSNAKTSPQTMSLASKLMAAGANQQLISTQLQSGAVAGSKKSAKSAVAVDEDGTLTIEHEEDTELDATQKLAQKDENSEGEPVDLELPEPNSKDTPTIEPIKPPSEQNGIKNVRPLPESSNIALPPSQNPPSVSTFPLEPPQMGGTLTANTAQEVYDPSTDPLSQSKTGDTMQHGANAVDPNSKVIDNESISKIETEVQSAHAQVPTEPPVHLDDARKAVEAAAIAQPTRLEPTQASGAQFLDPNVQAHNDAPVDLAPIPNPMPTPSPILPANQDFLPPAPVEPLTQPMQPMTQQPVSLPMPANGAPSAQDILASVAPMDSDVSAPPQPAPMPIPLTPAPNNLMPPDVGLPPEQTGVVNNPTAPPPVPPPMMPPTN